MTRFARRFRRYATDLRLNTAVWLTGRGPGDAATFLAGAGGTVAVLTLLGWWLG